MTQTQKLTQDKKNNSLFNAVKGRKFAKGGEVEKKWAKNVRLTEEWTVDTHTRMPIVV